jgi:hypothetical protein
MTDSPAAAHERLCRSASTSFSLLTAYPGAPGFRLRLNCLLPCIGHVHWWTSAGISSKKRQFSPLFGAFGAARGPQCSLRNTLQHHEIGHDPCAPGLGRAIAEQSGAGPPKAPYQVSLIVHYLDGSSQWASVTGRWTAEPGKSVRKNGETQLALTIVRGESSSASPTGSSDRRPASASKRPMEYPALHRLPTLSPRQDAPGNLAKCQAQEPKKQVLWDDHPCVGVSLWYPLL